MVLHLGGDVTVTSQKIVAIIDARTCVSQITQEFLEKQKKNITYISEDEYKSVIITEQKGKTRIYCSPISAATLCKRNCLE
ncbi:MAG TPA: DUF370 domain-containing protein [Clostridia bacterium]|nr:DUF370 domain-containing protein [Clostridia bacterium]